jgi:shikimate dehydrogenase
MSVPYAEVIGDPIAHSKSPAIHNFWLSKLGIEADYRACRVLPAELGAYFDARRRDEHWRGCNITMPHKIAALGYAHKHRDPSFPVEGINVAIPRPGEKLEGANTDGLGFLEPLLALQGGRFGQQPGAAIVVGGGGVLFSVMWALSALGHAPIYVAVRDSAKAGRIAEDYRGVHALPLTLGDALPPASLLVNATPLGMGGFPPFPLPLDSLAPDGIVYDLVYNPLETELIRSARARGLRVLDGLAMLIPQAAAAFQLFFGVAAPREFDAKLRELLTS